ncbi:hypothetical protein HII36_40315 [Nonomuraea sp. NN258]|uniref:glycosyltransferase family 39 protein n=1 Tax=Nonomuraea antri TaxID=2730852 RepID=UPI0015692E8A|nr:glycosyltransferase family 39 protein [Nonomuraea antri]NRQ38031.1 hypothetical protein [Nonomuraea antri]
MTALPLRGDPGRADGGTALAAVPVVAFLVLFLHGPAPPLWRDESVSALAARMPLAELFELLGDLDAVHALSYLILRPFAVLGGPPELVLRLPSMLAFTVAAYGLAVLGRRLAGTVAGVAGGLIYALTPIALRYAWEARSYALVSAVAVLAFWLLAEAVERPSRWRYAGYAASVALLGWLHLYALLLVPAHLVVVRTRGMLVPAHLVVARTRAVLVALAGAGAALVPLVIVAAGQREAQVFWLKRPGWAEVAAFPLEVAGGLWPAVALFGLALVGAARAPSVTWWAVLPVALSFAISQVQPVYHPRYVLFCVPALALLAGIGLARVVRSWPGVAASVVAFCLLTLPVPVHERPDDLRGLADVLAAEQRRGDAVLFVPRRFRLFVAVYAEPYEKLTDLTPRPPAELAGAGRVWLVSPRIGARYAAGEHYQALRRGLTPGQTRTFGTIHLTLYTRGH